MRLQRLQLARFGKFTDADIPLPQAAHDFHLIVGPNEAGKSTVRSAIADLLFGFPARYAAMAFVHPQSELRLEATLAEGAASLEVVRTKGNRNTLRTPAGVVLPDDALEPFIGQAERGFFETMFGLGHAQLVAGGELVLDASKDVSQVLFQSAAGIAGLGQVRASLQEEADRLWAPRHSVNRAYHAASDRYAQAARELKAATVGAKAWTQARDALDEVETRTAAAVNERVRLQAARARLERARRLAPALAAWKSGLAALDALGEVLELPAGAAAMLAAGEQALSVAETTLHQCRVSVEQLTRQRDEAVFDADVLAAKADIEALVSFGESVRNHYADLLLREAERDQASARARAACAELGWPVDADDAALRERLPQPLLQREVQRLVTEHGRLLQARDASARAEADKRQERDDTAAELAAIAAGEVSAALRGALSDAQAHRNSVSAQARLDAAVLSATRAQDAALAALAPWTGSIDALRRLQLPSAERLAGLLADRQRLSSEHLAALDRLGEAEREVDGARLAVRQFAEARRIVTGIEVVEARARRDADWRSIKAGDTPLATGAAGLDAAIALADRLVDAQLGSVTEAAELQSLRQRVERAEAERDGVAQAEARRRNALLAADQAWEAQASALGLTGLALADAPAWSTRREQALAAALSLAERDDDRRQALDAAAKATRGLAGQLSAAGIAVPEDGALQVVLALAEDHVAATDAAAARRAQLSRQHQAATAGITRLHEAASAAGAAYGEWAVRWSSAVAAAGLSGSLRTVDDAEHALGRVDAARLDLRKAADLQAERIDTMRRDLAEFDRLAARLVADLRLDELAGAQAREVVRLLASRLREAEDGQSRRAAADAALRAADAQCEDAARVLERAHAGLAPLLAAAGVASAAEAAPRVARSDEKRRLALEVSQARAALAQGADGLALDAVVAELEAGDPAQLQADLAATADALERVQTDLTRLAAERVQAELAVAAIGGGSDAAAAESRRQEALSSMADASERYIQLTTASRLLAWAIDRYRERNQGPMLSRAGAVFARLTLGRYVKLFVDFEQTPFRLSAQRAGGQIVEVPGMSEGTRDQLYLALRLAALELHLEKAKALPFVADDLFINFDDERSTAGLEALRELSTRTQVLFLSHHDHLVPRVKAVFGEGVNVVPLAR